MTGFGSLHRAGATLKIFDSASAASFAHAAEQLTAAESREAQSLIEHARSLGLNIVSALIAAVMNGGLDENELPSDALDSLLVEASDEQEGDDDELFDLMIGAVQDALESLSVDETTIAQMFSDDVEAADAAIEAACETALANLPDDGEPLDDFVREFVFGEPDTEGFDSAKLSVGKRTVKKKNGKSIAYKATFAVRKGHRVVVNKRLPNQKVRQTAAQKQAMKKARLKALTANALKMRVKSLKKGRKLGLY